MSTKVRIRVRFRNDWIFEGFGIHSAIVSKLTQDVEEKWQNEVAVLESSLDEIRMEYAGALPEADAKNELSAMIASLTAPDDMSSVCVIECEGAFPTAAGSESRPVMSAGEEVKDAPEKETVDTPVPAEEEKTGTVEAVLEKIEALTACRDFKQLAKDISITAPGILRDGTQELFFSEVYLLSANIGSGIHTTLSLFSELLEKTGLMKSAVTPEWIDLPSFEDGEVSRKMEKVRDTIQKAMQGSNLLCIESSEWLGHTHSREFKRLLLTIFRKNRKCIVIFRIPYVKPLKIEQTLADFSDLVSVRPLVYKPFSNTELRELAGKYLEKYKYSFSEDAWTQFDTRMALEKADGFFYGGHTVQKVLAGIIRKKQLLSAREGAQEKKITAELLQSTESEQEKITSDALKELRSMVGMQGVADRVQEIVNQIIYSRKKGLQNSPAMHMCFIGNPGTGKTTAARAIGEILNEKGILRVGKLFEHHGRDLCGEFVGQTAPKTRKICQEAYGSILFIDEAYSLANDESRNDYGREAIATLLTEMENNRDDMVVIFAGYPDDIQRLLDMNYGLRSRIPYTLEFKSYNSEELYKIFMSMADGEFTYSEDFAQHARAYFDSIPRETLEDKQFGNGRFARNMFERVWGKALARSSKDDFGSIELTCADFDLAAAEFDVKPKEIERKVGFTV